MRNDHVKPMSAVFILMVCAWGLLLYPRSSLITTDSAIASVNFIPPKAFDLDEIRSSNVTNEVPQTLPHCTLSHMSQIQARDGYFHSEGHWDEEIKANNLTRSQFNPGSCFFKYADISGNVLGNCLKTAKIHSIVTVGDSNAGKYITALMQHTKKIPAECTLVKQEKILGAGFITDKDYFTGNFTDADKKLIGSNRFCRTCAAQKHRCTMQLGEHNAGVFQSNITFERLPSTQLSSDVDQHRYTLADFYFKIYLRRSFPDVLLIFLPFNHLKKFDTVNVHKETMERFHATTKSVVPKETKVFYFPAFREFEEPKPKSWKNRRFHGLFASDVIGRLNHALYGVIKDDVTNISSNIHGFFDLFALSAEKQRWSRDGVHMQPQWYSMWMSHFLETLCSDSMIYV